MTRDGLWIRVLPPIARENYRTWHRKCERCHVANVTSHVMRDAEPVMDVCRNCAIGARKSLEHQPAVAI